MIDKKHLRKTLLQYRRLLPQEEFDRRNRYLCEELLKLIRHNDFQSIHCFLPITRNREPDLTSLFSTLWAEGRKVLVSKSDFENKIMEHFWLDYHTKLNTNHLGIPEPVSAKSADIEEADLIILPLMAVDKKGNRIGYGGGFYDRLLSGFSGETVGVSLSSLFDDLGTDEWDIPVKQVLFYRPND